MKKIKFNGLKINTDADDSSYRNKNIRESITSNNSNMAGINQHSLRNSKTINTNTLNLNTLSPKNFSIVHSTKSNKISEFSKRPSINSLTNDNRRSLVENKNEYKINNEKKNSFGNTNLIGSLSPKIPNGILSKNSKIFF